MLINKLNFDRINTCNKYIAKWSGSEDSSQCNPCLCALFLLMFITMFHVEHWKEELVMKHNNYFKICINLAKKAKKKGEIPVGAIIVFNDKIIAKSYNLREKRHDITAHAEILAIKKASKILKRWNLNDCTLYVTLKPCSMCASVINQSRIKEVYYLADKLGYKKEYSKTTYQQLSFEDLESEYLEILSSFFSNKR